MFVCVEKECLYATKGQTYGKYVKSDVFFLWKFVSRCVMKQTLNLNKKDSNEWLYKWWYKRRNKTNYILKSTNWGYTTTNISEAIVTSKGEELAVLGQESAEAEAHKDQEGGQDGCGEDAVWEGGVGEFEVNKWSWKKGLRVWIILIILLNTNGISVVWLKCFNATRYGLFEVGRVVTMTLLWSRLTQ